MTRSLQRRDAIAAIAGSSLVTIAAAGPRYFNANQIAMLRRLTDLILPADEHSPGAAEAKVGDFIDLMVGNSAPDVRDAWTAGLRDIDAEATRRFSKSFLDCDARMQDQLLAAMAEGETRPETGLHRFFILLKSMTIDGYYTSAIGIHRDLRYQGNRALEQFRGCEHPEHG